VDQRGLAGAVGADNGVDAAQRQVDADCVQGAQTPEIAGNAAGGEDRGAHGCGVWGKDDRDAGPGWARCPSLIMTPARPLGITATSAMKVRPNVRCQWFAMPPKMASDWNSSSSAIRPNAPSSAPQRLPLPPRITMSRTSPDCSQFSSSGLTKPSLAAKSIPAIPASAAASR